MAEVPDGLKYTAEHEWIAVPEGAADPVTVRVGITDYAQQSLGDVVYVSLPEVGADVTQGDSLGEVESTKSVSDLFAPVAGTVSRRNDALEASPDLINSDPYGEGWIIELTVTDAGQLAGLLDAATYGTLSG